jgi:FkbM family methyltransferase
LKPNTSPRPSKSNLLRNKWHGFRSSFAFSNWLELLLIRGLRPGRRIVVYEWRKRFILTCDTRVLDHYSPKEALADGAYDLSIKRSLRNGVCNYVNIGANIGAFDVAVAAQGKVACALSVEMSPRTYQRLLFNLQANDFSQVQTLNCGVAGESGIYQAALTDCSLADSLWSNQTQANVHETVAVPVQTLEECLLQADHSGAEFDLLKLDCEGAEYGIIRQSSVATLRRFRHVVMELHGTPPGESEEALRHKLTAAGFTARNLDGKRTRAASLSFWERTTLAP